MKIFVPTMTDCILVTNYDSCITSFRKHNANRSVSWVFEPKKADIIVLFEEWGTRFWGYADTLSDDPFFRNNCDRIFTINWDDLGRGFLPGCYTSLTKLNFEPQLHCPCVYPRTYNELVSVSYRQQKWKTKWLFSFRGTHISHPIRAELFRSFTTHPRAKMVRVDTPFHKHSEKQKQEFVDDILSSKFVLCPRGWSPATYRLFEAMELGRCPVIISDDWVPIRGVAWDQCSIMIKERDIRYCAEILAREECNAERLGEAARKAWESHFSEGRKFRAMLDSLIELKEKNGGDCDFRKRWSSWRFRYCNQWLPHQRLAKRIGREFEAMHSRIM
jgi:hypothetical protein